MLSIPRWSIPLQSTLNRVRFAETLLQTTPSLSHEDIPANASCLTFKWDTAHPTLYSRDDKTQVTLMVTPLYENSFGFKGPGLKGMLSPYLINYIELVSK